MDKAQYQTLIKNLLYYLQWLIGMIVLYCISWFWSTNDYIVIPLDNDQMLPCLKPKEFHWGKRILDTSTLNRGDVVYYDFPHKRAAARRECLFVSRIIGLPGDRIKFVDGKLYRNGQLTEEPYLDSQNLAKDNIGELTVPRDYVYLVNDNRRKQGTALYYRDSRLGGPVLINCLGGVLSVAANLSLGGQ